MDRFAFLIEGTSYVFNHIINLDTLYTDIIHYMYIILNDEK